MRIARLWSVVDADGNPDVEQGMTHIDESERSAFSAYLDSAELVIASPMTVKDQINPASGSGIPVMWFTDGEWIWSAQLSYYLDKYGLIFETDLLDHIRSAGFRPAPVAEELLAEAFQALRSVAEQG